MSAIAVFKRDIQKQIDEAKRKAANPADKINAIFYDVKVGQLEYCLALFDIYIRNGLIGDTEKGRGYVASDNASPIDK